MSELTVDEKWMHEALCLARLGIGKTRPNPPVGAVVVSKGRIVGRGYHRLAGTDHAEIVALKDAGRRAKGSTLYVTLEPCSTFGRTPPCTRAILSAGIIKVVVSAMDPNPAHNGRGLRLLKRAGLKVIDGVCESEGRILIAPFAKWIKTGMPYVTLKLGTSIDGKISDPSGASRWITSVDSRKIVMQLRGEVDAILVGAATGMLDNPSLLPDISSGSKPMRVIASARGALPLEAKVFSDGKAERTIIATTSRCPIPVAEAFVRTGAQVWRLPAKKGRVSIKALLKKLGHDGVLHVLCEGGGMLAGSMVLDGLVDEVLFMLAPIILGGSGTTPAIAGEGWPLNSAPRLNFTEVRKVGVDVLVRARFEKTQER